MNPVTELHVNGSKHSLKAAAERSLLGVLRDDLDLTGSKYGCGEGRCGACTVLIDGKAVRSCVTPVIECQGKQIRTIESLEKNGELHPLQQAFLDVGALQCGYCTAGVIMSGVALLAKNANPSAADIVRSLEENMCRCGTYSRIVSAFQKAATTMKGGGR